MNTNKQMYQAPSITEHVIELEQGIAAGSFGTGTTPTSPGLEDWTNGTDGNLSNGNLGEDL